MPVITLAPLSTFLLQIKFKERQFSALSFIRMGDFVALSGLKNVYFQIPFIRHQGSTSDLFWMCHVIFSLDYQLAPKLLTHVLTLTA